MIKSLCKKFSISHALLSSTRDIDWDVIEKATPYIIIDVLDHTTNTPINNLYETPQTLGKDRLAAVIGAHVAFADSSVLVIDIGTCMTLDVIDRYGNYHGGNISPGIHLFIRYNWRTAPAA